MNDKIEPYLEELRKQAIKALPFIKSKRVKDNIKKAIADLDKAMKTWPK